MIRLRHAVVPALALLIVSACGNSSSSTTAGAGGGAGGGGATDCKSFGTNQCFSNDDCTSASNRCQDKGTADAPLACCLPGARGTGMAGASCKTTNDCVTVCVDDGTNSNTNLCSKACTADSDCPSALPSCVTLNTGIGTGSFCGPG